MDLRSRVSFGLLTLQLLLDEILQRHAFTLRGKKGKSRGWVEEQGGEGLGNTGMLLADFDDLTSGM